MIRAAMRWRRLEFQVCGLHTLSIDIELICCALLLHVLRSSVARMASGAVWYLPLASTSHPYTLKIDS